MQSASDKRVEILFAMAVPDPREELLIKSIIRVLDSRAAHKWVFSELKHDVVIAAAESPTAASSNPISLFPMVLIIGDIAKPGMAFVPRPISAENLEAQLFRVAVKLTIAKNKILPVDPGSGTTALVEQLTYQLKRWPPAHLVASMERLRLATLISASPMGVLGMQKRSGVDLQVCHLFIADLARVDLLQTRTELVALDPLAAAAQSPSGVSASSQKAEKMGFLARIRQRLAQQMSSK